MRNSLASQREFDFESFTPDVAPSPRSGTSDVAFPNFQVLNDGQAVATASRRAGRLNAASISEEEVDALLDERSKLLDKKFAGTMTRAESIRLTYVRWSLDRIDDAQQGAQLDALDALVTQYEQLQLDLQSLKESIERQSSSKKK